MLHCPALVLEIVTLRLYSVQVKVFFLSVSMHESHCFNYIHVITSINYNARVCWVEACVLKFLIM